MSIATSASLDMRGKTITTFIAYGAAKRLAAMADGQALELLTDPGDDIGNDIRAWCRASGLDLVSADRADGTCQYVITKQPPRRSGRPPGSGHLRPGTSGTAITAGLRAGRRP